MPSTLPENKCQLGMVSKHSHHSFPNAPTLSSPSHSSPKCSTPFVAGPCHACCPRLALPHLPQPCCSMQVKSSCAPAPDLAQHSSLCVSYKKPPEELPLHLKSSLLGAGFFWGGSRGVCVWGFCVTGFFVCPIPPAAGFSLHHPQPKEICHCAVYGVLVVQFSCNYQ